MKRSLRHATNQKGNRTIPVYMPHADLTIRAGYSHCGYMAAHPEEYAEEIEAFLRRGEP